MSTSHQHQADFTANGPYNKPCRATTICPRPSPPSVGAEVPRAAEPTAPDRNVAVGSHGEYVPTVTAAAT